MLKPCYYNCCCCTKTFGMPPSSRRHVAGDGADGRTSTETFRPPHPLRRAAALCTRCRRLFRREQQHTRQNNNSPDDIRMSVFATRRRTRRLPEYDVCCVGLQIALCARRRVKKKKKAGLTAAAGGFVSARIGPARKYRI